MADLKISQLTGATTPLAGTEVLPVVQSGVTKQVSVENLTAGRSITAVQLTLTAGNLIPASGYGIDFSAGSSAPGMTSELLDDYEEGTWTTTYGATSNLVGSPSLRDALYTRIGRTVHLEGIFDVNVLLGSTLTYFVFNLPIGTAANASGTTGVLASNSGLKIGSCVDASAAGNGQLLVFFPAQAAQPSGADSLNFSITYEAA